MIKTIENSLVQSCHLKDLKEVMDYAVLPAGKLFRPKLVEALSLDLNNEITQNEKHLGAAIELHHAYTLVHDDLPSMDNDLIRRGKPSTHAKYGEWKAVLAGDSLLISSFEELMKISHPEIIRLHRLFTWATGARGLIAGQFLDLGAKGKLNISRVLRVHELKTARLIQVATCGTYLLSSREKNLRGFIEHLRLGREIGLTFQLLDDLNELTAPEVSDHERDINPFLLATSDALGELRLSHMRLTAIIFKYRLNHIEKMLLEYFKKNQENLLTNFENLNQNLKQDVVMTDMKEWITSFV